MRIIFLLASLLCLFAINLHAGNDNFDIPKDWKLGHRELKAVMDGYKLKVYYNVDTRQGEAKKTQAAKEKLREDYRNSDNKDKTNLQFQIVFGTCVNKAVKKVTWTSWGNNKKGEVSAKLVGNIVTVLWEVELPKNIINNHNRQTGFGPYWATIERDSSHRTRFFGTEYKSVFEQLDESWADASKRRFGLFKTAAKFGVSCKPQRNDPPAQNCSAVGGQITLDNRCLCSYESGLSLCELPQCGDGIVEGTEECDEGDQNGSPDNCTENCRYPDDVYTGTEQQY